MSITSLPHGFATEGMNESDLEPILDAEEATGCTLPPILDKVRSSGSLFSQRLAIGILISIFGLTCVLGFSMLSAGLGSGVRAAQKPMESGLKLNAVGSYTNRPTGQQARDVGREAGHMLNVITAAYRLEDDAERTYRVFKKLKNSSKGATDKLAKLQNKMREKILHTFSPRIPNENNITAITSAAFNDLNIPSQDIDRHDGNACANDEELFDNLCYKKCSEFHHGKYPLRTTPFSCCQSKPCGFYNQKASMKFCGEYNVAGDSHDAACPHAPGSCLANEELYLSVCYKKCKILTGFAFPFRLAPATCCKVEGKLACMNPKLSRVSPKFNVGGGAFYGDEKSPSQPHPPIPALAEAQPQKKT